MRVALYGGSFNPPHVAHQMVALYVLETARPKVDELWFAPTFKHPFDKSLESFEHRYRMCELAARALGSRVRVSDVESKLPGDSVTLRTIERLRAAHPDVTWALVIGSDLVSEMDSWDRGDELKRAVPLIVVNRAGGGDLRGVAMPAVSSTGVREALAGGHDDEARALVPRDVFDYIRQHGLYRGTAKP